MKSELTKELLRIAAKHEFQSLLYWDFDKEKEEPVFFVPLNDFWAPACSDAEDIETKEDIEMIDKACEDCEKTKRLRSHWGLYLYACRKSGYSPMDGYFKYIDEELHELFREVEKND